MFPGGPAVPKLGLELEERVGKVGPQSWASWSKDPGKAGGCQGWALEPGAGRWEGKGFPVAASACIPLTPTLHRSLWDGSQALKSIWAAMGWGGSPTSCPTLPEPAVYPTVNGAQSCSPGPQEEGEKQLGLPGLG